MSGLILTLFGIRFIGRPLRQLIEKTREIGQGDLTTPLPLSGSDELSELARKLNTMCVQLSASQNQVHEEAAARVEAVEQLRHADRLRTVGRLASGLAHELGTPLNVVAGRASLIHSGKLSATEITESSKTIRKEADRMTGILRQLLDFARRSPPQTKADRSTKSSRPVRLSYSLLWSRKAMYGFNSSLLRKHFPFKLILSSFDR